MQAIEVNGKPITTEEIYQEMQFFPSDSPDEAITAASRSLVISELLRQRAEALGLALDKDEQWLDDLLAGEAPAREPDQTEVQRFYEAQPEQFSSSPLAEVRHILLGVAPDDVAGRDQRREEGMALIRHLLESPKDFERLARKHSDCPSKETGGSLGQISREQTVPEFEKAVFRAEPGLMDRPVETRYGVHVVWVDRIIPGRQLPLDMVEPRIREYLKERSERQALSDYLHRLVEAAQIQGIEMEQAPLIQ